MTSDARIEAIRKRAEKATKAEPLPWKASYTNGDGLWGIKMGGGNEIITGIDANGNSDVTTFLAHSPTDIEYLLSKLDAAERMAKWLEVNEANCPCGDCGPATEALAAYRAAGKEQVEPDPCDERDKRGMP